MFYRVKRFAVAGGKGRKSTMQNRWKNGGSIHMADGYDTLYTMPVGSLGIIGMKGCEKLVESVDHYTNGGFFKDGRMIALFMAQAGLGKSVFLSNLAVNFLKQNLSVVVISLEMSQDVYAQRFDAHISGKNINRQKTPRRQEGFLRMRGFISNRHKSYRFII